MVQEDVKNLTQKLREIEEQCAEAMREIPPGLTHSRIRHVRTLAQFCRMALEGQPVSPVASLRDEASGDRSQQ